MKVSKMLFLDKEYDMSNSLESLYSYPNFSMTNGMILSEIMGQKNISYDDLFSILGPKSLIIEIINNKRPLKSSQIKQLSEFLGINQEVFAVESVQNENLEHNNDFNENYKANAADFENDQNQQLFQNDTNPENNQFNELENQDSYWKD